MTVKQRISSQTRTRETVRVGDSPVLWTSNGRDVDLQTAGGGGYRVRESRRGSFETT